MVPRASEALANCPRCGAPVGKELECSYCGCPYPLVQAQEVLFPSVSVTTDCTSTSTSTVEDMQLDLTTRIEQMQRQIGLRLLGH